MRNMCVELSSSTNITLHKVRSAKRLFVPVVILVNIMFSVGSAVAWPVFSDPVVYPLSVKPHDIDCGDFNGDDNVDIAFGCLASYYGVMLGNGDGSFQEPSLYSIDYLYVETLACGDFNNDGLDNFAIEGYQSQDLRILLSNGDGTFTESSFYPEECFNYFVLAYIDDDDFLDLAGNRGGLCVRQGNGDGSLSIAVTFPAGIYVYSVSFYDVTGDNVPDAILPGYSYLPVPYPSFSILPGIGNGMFGDPDVYEVLTSGEKHYAACADFDGDDWCDLALSNDPGSLVGNTLEVLLNKGFGLFPEEPDQVLLVGFDGEELLTEDYNCDGNADLIIVNDEFGRLYLGNGDGSFSFGEYLFTEEMWHTRTSRITQADFDEDGVMDVAFSNEASSYFEIVILLNTTEPQGTGEQAVQTGVFSLTASHSPFSENVTVTANGFSLPGQLNVYDITGRLIRSLGNEGGGSFIWNGTDASGDEAPSGTYIIQGVSEDHLACLKVVKL